MTKGRKTLLIGAGVVGVGVVAYIYYRKQSSSSGEEPPISYEYAPPGEAIAGGTSGGGGGGASVEPIASGQAGGETPAAGGAAEHVNRNQSPTGPFAGGSWTPKPHPRNQQEPAGGGSRNQQAPGGGSRNQQGPGVTIGVGSTGRPPGVHLEPEQGHRGQRNEIVTGPEHGHVHPRQAQKRVPVQKR